MSSLSAFFPSKLLGMQNRERALANHPLNKLQFVLDTMPGSRKYVFTPATRLEILAEMYEAFWGNYPHLFLPNSATTMPWNTMLSELQARAGTSKELSVTPGRPCGRIFKKGEACFRCKYVS